MSSSRLKAAVGKTLTILSEQPVDTAVLNLNIAGELIYPVADELTSRSLPCIFVTD